jgi:hypothetical protein
MLSQLKTIADSINDKKLHRQMSLILVDRKLTDSIKCKKILTLIEKIESGSESEVSDDESESEDEVEEPEPKKSKSEPEPKKSKSEPEPKKSKSEPKETEKQEKKLSQTNVKYKKQNFEYIPPKDRKSTRGDNNGYNSIFKQKKEEFMFADEFYIKAPKFEAYPFKTKATAEQKKTFSDSKGKYVTVSISFSDKIVEQVKKVKELDFFCEDSNWKCLDAVTTIMNEINPRSENIDLDECKKKIANCNLGKTNPSFKPIIKLLSSVVTSDVKYFLEIQKYYSDNWEL